MRAFFVFTNIVAAAILTVSAVACSDTKVEEQSAVQSTTTAPADTVSAPAIVPGDSTLQTSAEVAQQVKARRAILVSQVSRREINASYHRGESYFDDTTTTPALQFEIQAPIKGEVEVRISVTDLGCDGDLDHVEVAVEEKPGSRLFTVYSIFLKTPPSSPDADWRKRGFGSAPRAMAEIEQIFQELRLGQPQRTAKVIHLEPSGQVYLVRFEMPTPPNLARLIHFFRTKSPRELYEQPYSERS